MEGVGDFFVLARQEREGGTQGEGKRGYGRGFSEVMLEVRPAETCRFGQSSVIKKGESTNRDFLRIDSSLQQRRLPAVQLLLRTTGQLQASVVLINISANQRNNVRFSLKVVLPRQYLHLLHITQQKAKAKKKKNISGH